LTCWVALPSSRCRECDIQAVSATDVDHVRHVRPVVSSDRIAQISATRPWFDSRRLEFASSSTLAPGECQARGASGAAPRPRSTESMAPMKLQSSSRESPLSGNFDARRPITPGQGWRNPVDAMDSSDWPRGDGARRGTCAAPQKPLPSGRSPSPRPAAMQSDRRSRSPTDSLAGVGQHARDHLDASPAQLRDAPSATFGFGSEQPATTRTIPASRIASVHGGGPVATAGIWRSLRPPASQTARAGGVAPPARSCSDPGFRRSSGRARR
jgi:hypothetical protein